MRLHIQLLLLATVVVVCFHPASAAECTEPRSTPALLLAEHVQGNDEREHIETGYGLTDALQFATEIESATEGVENVAVLAAAIGVRIDCNGAAHLRLDIGAFHDYSENETVPYAQLIAGGPFPFGSWHAGTQSRADAATSYFGAAVLFPDVTPLALEARRENADGIWKTLFSAGLFLFTTESTELVLGLSRIGDSEADNDVGRQRLMLKLTGEF